MKNINILILGFVLMFGFNACQEDPIVTINPSAETGDMTFQLNQARYTGYTYELLESNNDLDMDALYASQPEYGFTAAVTYYIETSFTENMADAVELPSSVQGEKVSINTKELNRAILQLYKGQMPNPTVAKDVYFRLKAVVSQALPTPLDTVPTVKPLYSNVVKLKVLPYFIEDKVSFDKAKKLTYWYIVGTLGKGDHWINDASGVGHSTIPLGVLEGDLYDGEGNGTFSYTGYIKTSQNFKIVRDLGSWNVQWGNADGKAINKPILKLKDGDAEGTDFQVPEDGYYNITLNSINNTLKIEKVQITPAVHPNMGLVGTINDWGGGGADVVLQPFQAENNHYWYATYTVAAAGEVKFRVDNKWDLNWGNSTFPQGLATPGGPNVPIAAGTYTILFNDLDGFYQFIKK